MQIYVINLDRRPDRLAQMDTGLAALGLPFERIEAVDGTAADINSPADLPLSDAAYACYLSHLKAFRTFLETGASHCVIMEDDVVLSPRLPEALAASAFYQDPNAIIRLERPSNFYWRAPPFNKPFAVVSQNRLATYALVTKAFGTGAFVLSRQVAEAVIRQQSKPELDIDVRLFDPNRTGHLGFKILQFSPSLALQRQHYDGTNDSDIPHIRPNAKQVLHPILRNIARNYKRIVKSVIRLTGCSRRFPFADK